MNDTQATDLVQQGLTAARVGDMEDARRLLTKATAQKPENIEAWLGLAGVVDSLEEKKRCFEKVLALQPDNQEAQAGLTLVEKKLADQAPPAAETADSGLTVCYRHPDTETGLRCNRCNKPICPKCAQRTPVGFRCPECVREQEDKYYSGGSSDYVIAAVVSLPLTLITAGLFTFFLGRLWLLWMILIGIFVVPTIAGFIAEAVRWAVKKRRSRYLGRVVAICFVLGTLPFLILGFFGGGFFAPGVFLFFGTSTILARLR